jgi:hypothetical protein
MITKEDVDRVLKYDAVSGKFTWRVRTSIRVVVGGEAGSVTNFGYVSIRINGRAYQAHKLAWLVSTGCWPDRDIDHINGDRTDNRFCNLREATRSQNNYNAKRRSDNKSGYKGVFWNTQRQRWHARVQREGKQIHVGFFKCPTAAFLARRKVAQEHHGRFASDG